MSLRNTAIALALALSSTAAAQPLAETVGFTDRDRQMHGPAVRYLVNDTVRGVHAVWKNGYGEIRYNFRPRGGAWRWPGGMVVSTEARNLGCMDYDITTGCAVISCDHLDRGSPLMTVFKDSFPGAGRFAEEEIGRDARGPLVGTANYGFTKFIAAASETAYFRVFQSGWRLGYVGPFPSYNFAVSKQTGRYACFWNSSDGPDRDRLFLRITPNNGQNWYPLLALSDSIPSNLNRAPYAATGVLDTHRLHAVVACYDGGDANRTSIWHYTPYDTPGFSVVSSASLPRVTELGTLALAAGRPSIGMNRRLQEYYTVWEQFDPDNPDPATGLARADIWASRSVDTGKTWGPATRLTLPGSTSKRFPFVAEEANDTLHIIYFADSVAGTWEQGEGTQTTNAVIYLRVPVSGLPVAVSEPCRPEARLRAGVSPSVSRSGFEIHLPAALLPGRITVLDAAGRRVADFPVAGTTARWGDAAPPGVYFIRPGGAAAARVVKAH